MSLIEVMIAVTILAFALLPLFLYMRTGTQVVEGTREIATATFLASQALEEVRAWPFESLADEDLTRTGAPPGPSAESIMNGPESSRIQVGRVEFTRTVEITPTATSGADPDLKVVRVRVEWRRKDVPLAYEVTSVVVNDG